MKKRAVQKTDLIILSQRIHLWDGEMYQRVQAFIAKIDDKDQSVMDQLYHKIFRVYKAQQEVFLEMVKLDPQFPRKMQREMRLIYSQHAQSHTQTEQEEAESLLNFDDA